MKKLILIPIIFLFSQCEIKMKPVNAQDIRIYSIEDQWINGMHYKIYSVSSNTSQTGYSIHSINITKDSLECEYYKKILK